MSSISKEALLNVLATEDALHVMELSRVLDAHPITVDRHCYDLNAEGFIRQKANGVYVLTDLGEEHLQSVQNE